LAGGEGDAADMRLRGTGRVGAGRRGGPPLPRARVAGTGAGGARREARPVIGARQRLSIWTATLLGAACREAPVEPCPSLRVAGIAAERAAPVARATPFDSAFAAAGAEFHVPPALLKAIGWVETRWEMVQGAEEFAGRAPAFGVMALRGSALERGAARAGVTLEAARRDPLANIRTAAALLDAFADEAAIDRSRPEQWSGVIARYSEIERPDGRAAYGREVDRALGAGSPQLDHAPAPPTACQPPPGSGGAPD